MNAGTDFSRSSLNTPSWFPASWARLLLHPAFPFIVIGLALVARLLVAVLIPVEPASDAAWYVGRALGLAAGEGYHENGIPTAYWPVGWPAILALGYSLTGSMSATVIALNLASALVVMLLILWFSRMATEIALVGRIALLVYALYPNHIAYTGQATTELIYTALAMGAFAVLIAGRKHLWLLFLSGLLFGIGTLVKPQTIMFPVGAVIALALVFRNYSWASAARAAIVVYLALVLVVLPWSYRNWTVFGEFVLVSTNGGTALLLGANDQVTGDHFEYQHTPVYDQLGIPWSQRVEGQVELNRAQKEAAVEWIRNNTGEYFAWMPKKVLLLWIKDTDGFWSFDRDYPDSTSLVRLAQYLNQALYMVVLLLAFVAGFVALFGLVRREGEKARMALLYCMPVFVTLLAAVFTGQIRYHFPAMPYLIILASWMLLHFSRPSMKREHRDD